MNFINKTIVSILLTALMSIPAGLWYLLYKIMEPTGFWQNLILFGLGAWMFAGLQLCLWIFLVAFVVNIWSD